LDWLTKGLNDINYWLVLLAGVVAMAIGYIWYHDKVFGEMWRKEVGLTKEQASSGGGMGPMMTQALVLALISQSVLYGILLASGTVGVSDSVALAVVLGFGFSFTTIGLNNLFARKSLTLSAIDTGYQISTLVAGAIIFALLG